MAAIYTPDETGIIRDPLMRLLRQIYLQRGITSDDFVRMHTAYWRRKSSVFATDPANTHRNNLRKVMQGDTITIRMFYELVLHIPNLALVRFSVTLMDPRTKEVRTYSDDDPLTDNAGSHFRMDDQLRTAVEKIAKLPQDTQKEALDALNAILAKAAPSQTIEVAGPDQEKPPAL